MSINIIPNQVIDFVNINDPSQECECKGRKFTRKVNINDDFEVEFNSTVVNSNTEFAQNLTGYVTGYSTATIDPHQIGGYFTGFFVPNEIVVGWAGSPYLLTNQYEFSIDNGLTWYNETTLPTLTFTGLTDGSYECIIRDTLNGTSYYQTIII